MITTPEPSKPGFGGFGVLLRGVGAFSIFKQDKESIANHYLLAKHQPATAD
jgi:hypothetical protein